MNQEKHKQVGQTQYGRVLKELAIELICANSSQAKGRVERNLTLQGRLVKEMRLQGIDTIEQANAWLPYFTADFNHSFAKPAQYPKDMHLTVFIVSHEINRMAGLMATWTFVAVKLAQTLQVELVLAFVLK
ncbi:hypothetical protein BCT38_07500 [Vibrio lentus]|nr:hypothetical protein BH583_16080 [Vibrio lentus]PME57088.1 hypothetical protein BCV33_10005 [Vibrio lentus]PMG64138.1 hypothetical protein BCU87_07875 [Vibrio lentus]PMI91940.1 hypothetical protein BCU33_10060 [Vibrio lentus]PMJ07410.1 hypothetical protein BCU31_23200 [Vibrio lentus]